MPSSRQATRAPAWSQRWLQHEKRPAKHIQSIKQPGAEHMGNCQNYGPFLGPYYNTGPNTGPNLGYPKRDHNFDNHPHALRRMPSQCLEEHASRFPKPR